MQVFRSVDEVLVHTLDYVLEDGHTVSPRGQETREVLGYSFRLDNPRSRKVYNPEREWSEELAIGELCWHFSGSDDVDFLTYYADTWAKFSEDGKRITGSCYGKKIFGDGCRGNKWRRLKRELFSDPQSRRTVVDIFDATEDLGSERPDVPCITSLQFILRNGALNCITTMRSNDVIWGLCYDVFLITMLQERLAREIDVELGWYQHEAGSMHVYERHYDMAERLVEYGVPENVSPMASMKEVSSISDFLEVEKLLRSGAPSGLSKASSLPAYWNKLSQPLIRKYWREHVDTQSLPEPSVLT